LGNVEDPNNGLISLALPSHFATEMKFSYKTTKMYLLGAIKNEREF
jgi:hypothetical protein